MPGCTALQRIARFCAVQAAATLRAFGPGEMRAGLGFLHAKPHSTPSAFAATPDELGAAWCDGRVQLPLQVKRNSTLFGQPLGAAMHFSFGELRQRMVCHP